MIAIHSGESIILVSAGKGLLGRIGQRSCVFLAGVCAASTVQVAGSEQDTINSSTGLDFVRSPMGVAIVRKQITTPTRLVTRSVRPILRSLRSTWLSLSLRPMFGVASTIAVSMEVVQTQERGSSF